MKKILLISGGLVLLVILSVPALFFIYKDKIRLKAEREINKNINGSLSFEDVSISMFKDFPNITLTLENVVVEGKGVFLADTLARIDELDIELKTSTLISGNEIEVKSTHLLRPLLYFETLKSGLANYENIVQTAPSPATAAADTTARINVSLDRISIEDGAIVYEDKSMGLFAEMKGLSYTGKGDFEKNIFDLETKTKVKEFTLDYGSIRYCSKKHVSIDLIMEMNLKENKFTFKENDIRVNHFKFSVEGTFTMLPDAYDIDLKFKTREATFKTILSLIPGLYMDDFKQIATAGEMQFDGFVKGKYSDTSIPAFLTNVKISDAMFKLDSLPDPVENIQMDLVIKNEYGIADSTIIDLRNFHMDMRKHPIHGRVKLKGYPHYIVDADVFADLDLAELEKMYPIKGIELKGKLSAELQAKGQYIASVFRHNDSLYINMPKQIPSFHFSMKLADGKIKYDHLPTAIENIQVHMTADNTTGKLESTVLDVKGFHLDMGKNPVHGYLKVSGYTNYVIDTDIKATIDLADLEKMYPIENLLMKGVLDLDVEANGIFNQTTKKFPMVDARFNLTNGYLKSGDYPEPLENIHLITEAVNQTGKLAGTKITISRLTYTLEDEPFEVSGSISDLEDYNYDLKIKGLVDLEKITKIYPIPGMQLKGEIDTDIETRGKLLDVEKGRYDKLKSEGSVEIKNFEMKSTDFPKTIQISDALFTFTPLKIVLERFKGKFGRSNVTMTGDLTDYMAFVSRNDDLITGDMNVKCDTLDLNEWYIPSAPSATTKTVQKANPAPVQPKTAWRVPPNINFTFDSDIEVVKYQDMNISNLDGEIKIKDEALTLHETGFNSLNAKFNLSGDYNTKDINHPIFDFALDIKELDINKAYKEIKLIRDMAPAAGNTYGELSISYKLQGELAPDMTPKTETLVGGGEIHIANAKINGMKIFEEISKTAKKDDINDPHLKDFSMTTEIRDNKIFVKPFDIKISGLNAEIEGVSEISGAISYIVKIELLPIEKLRIPFHVSGTYDNPKVAIGKGHSLPN